MKLSEIFAQLTYGELSQLSLGGVEAGAINVSNYPKVVAHINLGLLALYKRFPLKENRLMLQLQANQVVYPLTYDYAVTNPAVNGFTRYILDTVSEPFTSDILKVEKVITDNEYEIELGLNDGSDYGVTTPTAHTLRVPLAFVDSTLELPEKYVTDNLELVFRANHPLITIGVGFDPTTVNVELPYTHLEPLLYFVASRVNNPIGMTNEFHAGNSYAAKYEQACLLLEQKNLNVDQGSENTRLERNGWV